MENGKSEDLNVDQDEVADDLENEDEGWNGDEEGDEMDQLNNSMDFNDDNPFTN